MTAPTAIKATYSDLRLVKGRKVAVIYLEIPIEQAEEFVAAFGMPNPAEEKWVGIARLNGAAEATEPVEKWKPLHQHPAKACALLCQKETFWQFLRQYKGTRCDNEEDAAEYVRRLCGVNTRADFATNPVALRKWNTLERTYLAWLPEAA